MVSLVSEVEEIRPTIAIDGKTIGRSHDRSDRLGPLHLVSAWASETGLASGQVATQEKSHEITAFPEFIDRIDVKDAIATIDTGSPSGTAPGTKRGTCGVMETLLPERLYRTDQFFRLLSQLHILGVIHGTIRRF